MEEAKTTKKAFEFKKYKKIICSGIIASILLFLMVTAYIYPLAGKLNTYVLYMGSCEYPQLSLALSMIFEWYFIIAKAGFTTFGTFLSNQAVLPGLYSGLAMSIVPSNTYYYAFALISGFLGSYLMFRKDDSLKLASMTAIIPSTLILILAIVLNSIFSFGFGKGGYLVELFSIFDYLMIYLVNLVFLGSGSILGVLIKRKSYQ